MQASSLRATTPGVTWPALPTGLAAELLALQHQFDRTQWWTAEALRERQFHQLAPLLEQTATIPFHKVRLRKAGWRPGHAVTPELWRRLPPLTRADLQREGVALHAPHVPEAHGATTEIATGGSTGQPVRVRKTALEALLWNAMQVREELWHREDHGGHLARIRSIPVFLSPAQVAQLRSPDGFALPDWGPPCSLLWQTGGMTLIETTRSVADQVAFLRRLDPEYILTPPSNLRLIVAHCRIHGIRLPRLRAVWTLSEVVEDGLRDDCRAVLGARIVHNYSTAEAGYLALQCPEHELHSHVCAETVLLEVVDTQGHACAPGEVGRVLLTPLHNFAMPLLRYEVGDEAEVGPPCPCGRGLPVLRAVVGRTLDRLLLPDGTERRAELRHYRLARDPRVVEYQVVQRSLERVEILLVLTSPLDVSDEAALRELAREELGDGFRIDLTAVDSIPRTAAGKLRPFMSDLPQR